MKTTLDLRDDLLVQAKALAARQRKSLTRLIEEGMSLRLRATDSLRRKPNAIPVSTRGGGALPGVDLSSNRSMFDAADR